MTLKGLANALFLSILLLLSAACQSSDNACVSTTECFRGESCVAGRCTERITGADVQGADAEANDAQADVADTDVLDPATLRVTNFADGFQSAYLDTVKVVSLESGGRVVAGLFSGTLNFARDDISIDGNRSGADGFVAGFDEEHELIWLYQLRSYPGEKIVAGLARAAHGGVVITGDYLGELRVTSLKGGHASFDLDADPNFSRLYAISIRPDGSVAWTVNNLGTGAGLYPQDIVSSGDETVIVGKVRQYEEEVSVGFRQGEFYYGVDVGRQGDSAIFILRLNEAGIPFGVTAFASSEWAEALAVTSVPGSRDFIVAGRYRGDLFLPGPQPLEGTSLRHDLFIMRATAEGAVRWAKPLVYDTHATSSMDNVRPMRLATLTGGRFALLGDIQRQGPLILDDGVEVVLDGFIGGLFLATFFAEDGALAWVRVQQGGDTGVRSDVAGLPDGSIALATSIRGDVPFTTHDYNVEIGELESGISTTGAVVHFGPDGTLLSTTAISSPWSEALSIDAAGPGRVLVSGRFEDAGVFGDGGQTTASGRAGYLWELALE